MVKPREASAPATGREAMLRRAVLGFLAGLALAVPGRAGEAEDIDLAIRTLFGRDLAATAAAVAFLRERVRPEHAAALIRAFRYAPVDGATLNGLLRTATGASEPQGWFDWMLWQEVHPEIVPHADYAALTRDIFLSIDPAFAVFLKEEYLARDKMKIRLEEIAWGGVRKDGIPSLDNPNLIAADEADYLLADDLVFGVEINGDVRAYPLRIMGWHEMFNEVIGGVPVALAYCTLCGSGILYETAVAGRAKPFVFGSSGFLYRSNKLMFDRETHSLWNQFTGRPVTGPLAESAIALRQRPVAIARWADWRRDNPGTRVLSPDTGFLRDYGPGIVYRDYFASPDLMFPAIVDETALRQKDYVFGIRLMGGARAWPLTAFAGGRVINDALDATGLVLIGDEATRTVRAYEREAERFARGPSGTLITETGTWTTTEAALIGPAGEVRPRVAGHVAYWFAWDGYLGARSELYRE
jgi:hypothetical protein